ncbi:MAG TPA: ribosome maturation factor RimM [Marinagarivorans sp.]
MSDRIAVGHLVGVFGVKGWLKVKTNTQPAENIVSYQPWYLKTAHGLKVVEVDDYAFRPQGLVVHIKGYDDRDLSAALGKAAIEVDINQLPELESEEYYWHQLVGLKVYSVFAGDSSNRTVLGVIKNLMETGANDVLVVAPCDDSIDGRERLIPYLPGQFIKRIDLAAGEVDVDWDPEF